LERHRSPLPLGEVGAQRRVRGYGPSLDQRPLTRFAEFIIGRRFAPTRWQIDLSPLGRGKSICGPTDSNKIHLALARAERLEGDDGVGVLDAGKGLHLFVDEVADVGVVFDIEFNQQIVMPRGGVDLGGDFGLRERVGDGVGLAELAFDLNEEGNHRCRLRKRHRAWGSI
jgi:hypothetical protein